MKHALTLISLLYAAPALSEDICSADVNSTEILIDRDTLDAGTPGIRERGARWATLGVDRGLGRPPACDSETLISFLANEVPDEELSGYCLSEDDLLGYILVPGERNFRGRCARTTCDRVNATKDGAASVAGLATDIVTGRDDDQTRTDAVLHASGAAILSGTAASVFSSIGTAASSTLTAAMAGPAVAGAAAVSLVAVGGAVYLCHDGD